MMNNTLRRIETEQYVMYKECCFSPSCIEDAHAFFDNLKSEGKITGDFADSKWHCFSGICGYEVNFEFSRKEYDRHIGEVLRIPYKTMQLMIKCFAIYNTGDFIFSTIANDITNNIKSFLCHYGEKAYRTYSENVAKIESFLMFINTPEETINNIVMGIPRRKAPAATARTLSPLINYLVIENEINSMFSGSISDEDFIKYFPIYFWVNITFILPLRATEMMITPLNCLDYEGDSILLRVRRTQLKGYSENHHVYYEVDKDYKIFVYKLTETINRRVFDTIDKYLSITKEFPRKYLFVFSKYSRNGLLSLEAFNNLLSIFIKERVIGNPKYEYAKQVCGIKEFEVVTAGDSRPIAMANLFFQDTGADICRQLADHMRVTTSEGYFTNVSETILSSSIMQMQHRINQQYEKCFENQHEIIRTNKYGCSSPKHFLDENTLDGCDGHYEDCFGCKYYFPDHEEIQRNLNCRKERFEECMKRVQSTLSSKTKIRGKDIDINALLLDLHTTGAKFRESTDIFARRKAKEWAEQQNSAIIDC